MRSFIQQIFVEHLLYKKHSSRDWRQSSKQEMTVSGLWILYSSGERKTKNKSVKYSSCYGRISDKKETAGEGDREQQRLQFQISWPGPALLRRCGPNGKKQRASHWMYVGKAVRRGSAGLTAPRWSVAKQDEGRQQQGPEHAGSICHSKDWLYLSETGAFEEAEQQPHLA